MAGTGFSFTAAAKLAGLPVVAIEAEAKRGTIRVFRINGERVINDAGLSYLQGVAKARAEAEQGGSAPAARRSAGAEIEDDPSSWSEETIAKKGHALAAAIKGTDADPLLGGGAEKVFFDRSARG